MVLAIFISACVASVPQKATRCLDPMLAANSKDEATEALQADLQRDRQYLLAFPDLRCATFNAVPLDACDVWLIVVREDPSSDCDDAGLPTSWEQTFVVYLRSKTIVWFDPRTGLYESWQSFLAGGPS